MISRNDRLAVHGRCDGDSMVNMIHKDALALFSLIDMFDIINALAALRSRLSLFSRVLDFSRGTLCMSMC